MSAWLLRHGATAASSSSALATAAAATATDAWGTVTMSAVPNIGGAADTLLQYQSNWWYDPIYKKIRYFGSSHISGTGTRGYFDYRLATNDFSAVDNTAPDGASDPMHGYAGTALNPANGEMWWARGNYGSHEIYKRTVAGVWSQVTTFPYTTGWMHAVWHPTIGGTGGLVVFSEFQIAWFDGTTWHPLLSDGAGHLMTSGAGASAYNPRDACAYGGNTSGTNPGLYKVDASATVTKIADPPIPVAVQSTGSPFAMLCAPGNPANKLLCIGQAGPIHEYDDGADTWSAQISTLPSAIINATDNWWIASSISDERVVAFGYQNTNSTMSSTMHFLKH
jgi:hypothetical protein